MSFLRHHLSLLIPLIVFLFSFQFYITVDRMVEDYEARVIDDYSIVIAAEAEVDLRKLSDSITQIDSIEEIRPDQMLGKIKEEISAANFALLKVSLPKFYKITLSTFPNESELKSIEESLKNLAGIRRVETFSKTHNQIYRLLLIIQTVSQIFAISIFVIAFLLMMKQIEVWRFEHHERMAIMALFGSPFWMRSAMLFRLALADSCIAAIIISYLYYWIGSSGTITGTIRDIGLDRITFSPLADAPTLLGLALAVSLLTVTIVVSRARERIHD